MQNQMKSDDLSEVGIRRMTIEDYDAVMDLWDRAGLPYKPRGRDRKENISHELLQPTALFYIAETKGKIIGTIFGTHDGRKGWINRLAVDQTYRKQGIGKKLVRKVEQTLDAIGVDIVACLIEDWNTVSIEVFERMGYKKHDDITYLSKRKDADV